MTQEITYIFHGLIYELNKEMQINGGTVHSTGESFASALLSSCLVPILKDLKSLQGGAN